MYISKKVYINVNDLSSGSIVILSPPYSDMVDGWREAGGEPERGGGRLRGEALLRVSLVDHNLIRRKCLKKVQ